jgi:hypothetical protein
MTVQLTLQMEISCQHSSNKFFPWVPLGDNHKNILLWKDIINEKTIRDTKFSRAYLHCVVCDCLIPYEKVIIQGNP